MFHEFTHIRKSPDSGLPALLKGIILTSFVLLLALAPQAQASGKDRANSGEGRRVVTIAASNSSREDRKASDYVCDGQTDAQLITSVIDRLVANGDGGKIIFRQGRYFMNGLTRNNACIDISLGESNALIELCSEITDKNYIGGASQDGYNGAQFYMTEALYDSLDPSIQYKVVNCSANRWQGGIVVENIGIVLHSNRKQVVAWDMYSFCGMCRITGLHANAYSGSSVSVSKPPQVAVPGCIGLRTLCDTAAGPSGNDYRNVLMKGFHEGFAINSEHNLFVQAAAVFCVYGYTFDHYWKTTEGAEQHPNVLIKCIDERGVNLPRFYDNPRGQATVMIAYSTERKPVNTPGGLLGVGMTEEIPGQHCGTITYTMGGLRNNNSTSIPLWENGHGHGFRTTNLLHKQSCTSAERRSYSPNFMQRVWDTDLNLELICIDESVPLWSDALGNLHE